jgi:tetratricopeptide (TPR) repeat protein
VRQVLCPVLLGRDRELAQLEDALQAARIGRGGLVVVSGEAGIGKSRLAATLADRARSAGVAVGTGRAVEGGSHALRPFGEALNGVVREYGVPRDADLEAFRSLLSLFVPEWARDGRPTVEPGLVLLEGIHRLVRSLAKPHGLLLVLEDLHWADSDTLATVEYLADNTGSARVLCVCTERIGVPGNAQECLARLVGRRAAVRLSLPPLGDADVAAMARAALPAESVPTAVVAALRRRAEGVPFLVEEMLSAYLAAGGRPEGGADWWLAERVADALPPSLRELVRERLYTQDEPAREVVFAAAVLGRTFEWPLLSAATGQRPDAVLEALRTAVGVHLLASGGGSGAGTFGFRHALMREAVLAELLPPERAELSFQVAEAIEDHRPGLPGEWCDRAAELREQAGDALGACRLLQESARRALRRGALGSAEASLRRARRLAEGDYTLWMGVYTLLCEVLARAGKTVELVDLTRALVAEWEQTMRHAATSLARMLTAARRAKIHLEAARAGLVGGDFELVRQSLRNARTVASDEGITLAQAESIEAAAAFKQGHLDRSAALAAAALGDGERLGLSEVRHESLETLGRVALARGDVDRAAEHFGQLLRLASEAGATVWRVRAMAQLGAVEARHRGAAQVLEAARALAVEAGAVSSLANIDLDLGWHRLGLAQLDEADGFIDNAVDACERYGLPLLPDALLARCALYALRGNEEAMAAALDQAGAESRLDVLVALRGESEAVLAVVREEPAKARAVLDRHRR